MIVLVCLGSLLGVIIVPLISNEIHSNAKLSLKALVYKYIYSFMIALGTSALICDAVLHLIPHVSHDILLQVYHTTIITRNWLLYLVHIELPLRIALIHFSIRGAVWMYSMGP